MGIEEDNAVIIFMNTFNAAHAVNVLQVEIILMMQTCYNNKNLN